MARELILVVEPNKGVRLAAQRILARAGYQVQVAGELVDGLGKKGPEGESPSLVVLDAAQIGPALPILLLEYARSEGRRISLVVSVPAGQASTIAPFVGAVEQTGLVSVSGVIEKPFDATWLVTAVDEALSAHHEPTERLELGRLQPPVVPVEPFPEETTDQEGYLSLSVERYPEVTRAASSDLKGRAGRFAQRISSLMAGRAALSSEQAAALSEACERAFEDEEIVGRAPDRAEPTISSMPDRTIVEAPTPALAGRLGAVAIEQLLQFASTVGKSACCRLERGASAVEIFFCRGELVFARQSRLPPGFALGRFLVDRGVISEVALEHALGAEGWLGERLVELGLIQPGDVRDALRCQTEELFYEILRWHEGRFSVTPEQALPREAEGAEIHLVVQHVLLEGLRRLDEWRRISSEVGSLSTVIERLDPSDEDDALRRLAPEHLRLLNHVTGRRTIAELVRTAERPAYDVFKGLSNLQGQRLVALIHASA